MKIGHDKGLPELKHHILPRTKGFTLLLQGAEDQSNLQCFTPIRRTGMMLMPLVSAVYDLTIGFKTTAVKPSLLSIIKGHSCQAEIFIK